MTTAVDTSVLLDVLLDDPKFGPDSIAALQSASRDGQLVICETTLAEITPVVGRDAIESFLTEWDLLYDPTGKAAAILAGSMFQGYLDRGGKRGRVVPDFIIAAHAQLQSDRLLARDRGYYRDYFTNLTLWIPGQPINQ